MEKINLLKKFAKGEISYRSKDSFENCVSYYRVSSKEQIETGKSLEWQRDICEKYARDHNLIIKKSFGGTYESAKSDEREEFQRMLSFIKQNKKERITCILVHSLDRFSRTGGNAIYISEQLKSAGVHIVSATQQMDTYTHSGTFQQNIHFIFSKYENDIRRQKSVDGMRAKLQRGEWLGNCPIGYEYDKTKGTQTIIISKKGPFIKRAFEMRASGLKIEEILAYLRRNEIDLYKQNLSKIFRNPFYCGFLSHNFLNGDLIKGKHEALISEELFLAAHKLCKKDNSRHKKENDALPLKGFVKDAASGANFTGYKSSKGYYYYKANAPGVNVNRSQVKMHEWFIEVLSQFEVDKRFIEPLIKQLVLTFNVLTENQRGDQIRSGIRLEAISQQMGKLEERFAYGEISKGIFDKYSEPLRAEKEKIEEEIRNMDLDLSNPEGLIKESVELSSNILKMWMSGNYYQKRRLQNLIFPEGVWFDAEKDEYRTLKINSFFKLIAHLSKGARAPKKEDSPNSAGESPSVLRRRLELPRLAAYAPQAYVYTIPPPEQEVFSILPGNSREQMTRYQGTRQSESNSLH